jgi:putative copper export protein
VIAAARGIAFLGMMLLAGGGLYAVQLGRTGIPARLPFRNGLIALALIANVGWLALAAGAMAGTTPDIAILRTTVTGTMFGRVAVMRLLLLLALFTARGPRATAILGGLALLSPALTSHAATSSPAGFGAIGTVLDAVHLACAGFWVGGLALLAVLFARREPKIMPALVLFSDWALVAVALLAMTGLINAAQILLGGEHGAPNSFYIAVLGVKLALVAAMLALAAINRLRLMPRGDAHAIGRNATLELAFGFTAVLLAGWLGQLPPVR